MVCSLLDEYVEIRLLTYLPLYEVGSFLAYLKMHDLTLLIHAPFKRLLETANTLMNRSF